jgi:hypothetical protein
MTFSAMAIGFWEGFYRRLNCRPRSFSPSTAIHAESPLPCITVAGLSPGIRPVGAGLCPPTWVAGVTPAPRRHPRSHPCGTPGRFHVGQRRNGAGVTPAPRWSRSPQTKPHAPNPSPQPSHKKPVGREPVTARGRGFLSLTLGSPLYFPLIMPWSLVAYASPPRRRPSSGF